MKVVPVLGECRCFAQCSRCARVKLWHGDQCSIEFVASAVVITELRDDQLAERLIRRQAIEHSAKGTHQIDELHGALEYWIRGPERPLRV